MPGRIHLVRNRTGQSCFGSGCQAELASCGRSCRDFDMLIHEPITKEELVLVTTCVRDEVPHNKTTGHTVTASYPKGGGFAPPGRRLVAAWSNVCRREEGPPF